MFFIRAIGSYLAVIVISNFTLRKISVVIFTNVLNVVSNKLHRIHNNAQVTDLCNDDRLSTVNSLKAFWKMKISIIFSSFRSLKVKKHGLCSWVQRFTSRYIIRRRLQFLRIVINIKQPNYILCTYMYTNILVWVHRYNSLLGKIDSTRLGKRSATYYTYYYILCTRITST